MSCSEESAKYIVDKLRDKFGKAIKEVDDITLISRYYRWTMDFCLEDDSEGIIAFLNGKDA